MEEGLKIIIGADVSGLIAGLSKATAFLKEFGSLGEANAKQIEKALKDLNKVAGKVTGAELERVNSVIAQLTATANELRAKGTASFGAVGASIKELGADATSVAPQVQAFSEAVKTIPEGTFTVTLDAEVAQYLPKIQGASEALKQLGLTGQISGAQAEKALIELGNAAKTASATDLLKINTAITAIGTASTNFKTAATQAFDSFGKSVEQATTKIELVSPAIAKAEQDVKVLETSGFTIKINAETQEAIAGLRFVTKATKELGASGEANIAQVEKAIKDLQAALKNGGGGVVEIERIKTALSGMTAIATQFGNAGKEGFDKFGQAIPSLVAQIESIPTGVNTAFTTSGLEASTAQVETFEASIRQVQGEGNVEVLLSVEAKQAISTLSLTSNALEELGTVGKGSISTVNIALAQLQQAAAKAGGVDLQNINVAIEAIIASSTQLGLSTTTAFNSLSTGAEGTLGALAAIPPAVQKITDVVDTIDGNINLTPTVDNTVAVEKLQVIGNQAEDTKAKVEAIDDVPVVVKGSAVGLDTTEEQARRLDEQIKLLRKNGDFELELSINAQGAIRNLGETNQALEIMRQTGTATAKDVENALDFLRQAAKKDGAEINKINAAMEQLVSTSKQFGNVGKVGFDQFGVKVSDATKKLNYLKASTGSAGQALVEVRRIVQDAPFSILSGNLIAVSNNIDPLVQSFRRLRAEAGSTSATFKALGAGLIGGGGIALAVSVIVAAVTLFSAKASEAKREVKGLKDETADLTKSIGEEASKVATLVTALQSDTLSRKEKTEALKQLKKESPEYFGQLKEEKGLVDNLTGAYAAYLGGLSKTFKTRALKKQLDELFDRKVQLEAQIDPEVGKLGPAELKKIAELKRQLTQLGDPVIDFNKPLDQLTDVERKAISIRDAIRNVSANIFDFSNAKGQLADVDKQINGLLIRIGAMGSFDLNLTGDTKESNNQLKDRISILSDLRKSVGLTKEKEQELLNLMLLDRSLELKKAGIAGEQLARSLDKVKIDFQLEGIDIAIAKLQDLAKTANLTGKQQGLLLDLKFDKFDLEFPEASEIQRQQAFQDFIQQVKQLGADPALILRVATEFELKDTPESIIKKITPDGGFKIPISVAAAVAPLPASIPDPTVDKTKDDELAKRIAKTKEYANVISQELTPVFASLFDTIGKGGTSALQALGDALKQILKKLAAAAIQAAIFAAVLSATGLGGIPGGGQFGKIFVGQLKSGFGLQANLGKQGGRLSRGMFANNLNVNVSGRVEGNSLRLVMDRVDRSNGRLF